MNILSAIETAVLSKDLKSINHALSGYSGQMEEYYYQNVTGKDLVRKICPMDFNIDKYNLEDFFDSITDEEKTSTSKRTIIGHVVNHFEIDIPDGEDADDFIENLYHNDIDCHNADICTDYVTTSYNFQVAITTSVMNKLNKCFIPLTQEIA